MTDTSKNLHQDGSDHIEEHQLELDAVDEGADPLAVLEARLSRSQAAMDASLHELRAVMSDAQALEEYGIDTTQI